MVFYISRPNNGHANYTIGIDEHFIKIKTIVLHTRIAA